ncbi:alkaline phosphatase family protein [Shewanella woodyi]|uniref:alkaline phosphatase family protein n=1 Tax=Shewanella woodyi TaxID=60961 RepID=UPI00374884A3
MEKTILVVLDAFRHDYIDPELTPFLFSLLDSSKYYKKIIPSYGFCERTEIMVGLEPSESNYFTAIGYDSDYSPYKHISGLLKLLSRVEKSSPRLVNKVIRRLLWEYISRRDYGFASVNIPMNSLAHFSLTEDGKDSIINSSPESIINLARKFEKTVSLSSFTSLDSKMMGNDDDRIENLISEVSESNDSLYLLYISSADHFGHKYGPDSEPFKVELLNLDKKISELYKSVNNITEQVNWMFVGDHGMTEIEYKLDIIRSIDLALSEFKFGVDFIYFADSTVFRVWYLDKAKEELINSKLVSLFSESEFFNKGHLTTETEIGLVGDRTYGDLLWLANPGVVINPDFFNTSNKELNGMHGYNPFLSETCFGMAILKGSKFSTEHVDKSSLKCIYDEIRKIICGKDEFKN